jgi:serine/threonine-protein kinase
MATRLERPKAVQPPAAKPKFPTPEPELRSKPDDEDELVGKEIDDKHYHIIKSIGEGGMGHVYLASNMKIPGMMVAIKVMRKTAGLFQKEALAALGICQDNVVRVIDYGLIEKDKKDGEDEKKENEKEGRPYLVMEYLEGMDMSGLLERKGQLEWPVARQIMLQVCAALQAAHEVGVVHLDMKPMNVFLVDPEGKNFVKVLDFGISQLSESMTGIQSFSTRGFVGTAAYAPPEQSWGSKACDHRSDIYAVGVMLYEMLCGSLPFVSTSVRETRLMHEECAPPPFSTHRPASGIPDGVEAAVMRCLEKDKEKRYQSMVELAHALLDVDKRSRQILSMPGMLQEDDYDQMPLRHRTESSSFAGWVAAALISAAVAGGIWIHAKDRGDAPVTLNQDAQPALAERPDASVEHPAEKQELKKAHKAHKHGRSAKRATSQKEGHTQGDQDKSADNPDDEQAVPGEGTSEWSQ